MKRSIASIIGITALSAIGVAVAASALRIGLGIDGEIAAWNGMIERYIARVDARLGSAIPSRERLVIASAAFFALEPPFPMEATITSVSGETVFLSRSTGYKGASSGIDALRSFEIKKDLGPHGYVGLSLSVKAALPSDSLLMPALRDAFVAILTFTALSGLGLILLTRPRPAVASEARDSSTSEVGATIPEGASSSATPSAFEADSAGLPHIDEAELIGKEEGASVEPEVLRREHPSLDDDRFIPRLKGEISRALRGGSELCLCLVRCGKGPEGMREDLTTKAAKAGAYEDLCYGYSGGLAIISPFSARESMRMAEALYLSIGLDPAYEGHHIGLSSLAGRDMPSELLVEEASAALERAASTQGMRLVAFKPDPDKYRELHGAMGETVDHR
jgi:hypothetical protein